MAGIVVEGIFLVFELFNSCQDPINDLVRYAAVSVFNRING